MNGGAKCPRRPLAAALMALLSLGVAAFRAEAAESASLESQVKSAFVLNFLAFVDWPEGSFAKSDDPLVIGVVGSEGMAQTLPTAVEGKTIKGRKIVVKQFSPQNVGACHVLIVGAGQPAEVIKPLRTSPTLTIGEEENFTVSGGVIRFYLEDRKVRFEINLAAVERARLQVSSKLLKLAKVVKS